MQRVMPASQELDEALRIAERIAAQGPMAAMADFIETQKRLSNSEDAAEGVRSFIERRPSRFTGR